MDKFTIFIYYSFLFNPMKEGVTLSCIGLLIVVFRFTYGKSFHVSVILTRRLYVEQHPLNISWSLNDIDRLNKNSFVLCRLFYD